MQPHAYLRNRPLGVALFEKGRYTEAKEALLQSIEIFRGAKNREEEINSLFRLINIYWGVDDYVQASQYVELAVELCQTFGNKFYRAGGTYLLAHDHLTNSRFAEAEIAFQKALKSFEKMNHKRFTYLCLSSLREIYSYRGRLREAEALSKQLIDVFHKRGMAGVEASHIPGLGNVYLEIDNLEKAELCYFSALKTFSKLNQHLQLPLALLRLSELALKKGELQKALGYAMQAKKAVGTERVRRSQVHRTLGMCHAALGHIEKASEWFDKGIAALKDRPGFHLALALLDAGKFHTSTGEYDSAEKQLGRAVEMLEKMGADHYLKKAQQAWSELMDAREKKMRAKKKREQRRPRLRRTGRRNGRGYRTGIKPEHRPTARRNR